jgi:tRNA nucleotidyltransferase (CCA-adding enzyme)
MPAKLNRVLATVLKRITPDKRERIEVNALAKKIERNVVVASKRLGVKARVRLEGSVAKDTWISDERDIDIFMRVSTAIPRKSLGEVCLRVARKATEGSQQIERFAEHPYLEVFVENVRVNIVPCYDAKAGNWLSATDRTPFHTDYINEHFDERLRSEVRLLKSFMKGTDVYGAEIKVGGFSGYLCELLILHYGSFVGVLKAFVGQQRRIVIDVENYYRNRDNELRPLFNEPLVIVDPVDKGRNVASAVKSQKLFTFIAAAQTFLKHPSLDFFYPPETKPLTARVLKTELEKRGSKIIFLVFANVGAVPDILWGQLYKSQRSLRKLIELNDFRILRDLAWSDETSLNVFVFELEDCCIPSVKKHLGPPLEKEHECEKFLAKHNDGSGTVSGPYVEDGRWVVQVRRKYTDACKLLCDRLRDGGRSAGVADQISQILHKGFQIYVNAEIVSVYCGNAAFARFLTGFLSGKPKWLEAG